MLHKILLTYICCALVELDNKLQKCTVHKAKYCKICCSNKRELAAVARYTPIRNFNWFAWEQTISAQKAGHSLIHDHIWQPMFNALPAFDRLTAVREQG